VQQQHSPDPYLSHSPSYKRLSTDSALLMNDWIKLNVGGRLFTTTRSTLIKYPYSMLGRMFDDTRWASAIDQDGSYLIDHDPNQFDAILNYLRFVRRSLVRSLRASSTLLTSRFTALATLSSTPIRRSRAYCRLLDSFIWFQWSRSLSEGSKQRGMLALALFLSPSC